MYMRALLFKLQNRTTARFMAEPEGTGNTGSGGTPPPAKGEGDAGGKVTFTPEQQAHIDKLIGERAVQAGRGKVDPKDLGFASKAELEAAIAAHQQTLEDAQSDQEKAVQKARKEGAEQASQELMGKANARMIKSEFVAAAANKGVVAPTDLYLIAQAEGRFNDVTVGDADEVVGLDDSWWEGLLKGRDHLVGESNSSSTSGGSNVNGGSNGSSSQASGAPKKKLDTDRKAELAKTFPSLGRR